MGAIAVRLPGLDAPVWNILLVLSRPARFDERPFCSLGAKGTVLIVHRSLPVQKQSNEAGFRSSLVGPYLTPLADVKTGSRQTGLRTTHSILLPASEGREWSVIAESCGPTSRLLIGAPQGAVLASPPALGG